MTETVLLVEDEVQVNRLVAKVLEMRGYSVLSAESSAHAIRLSESHAGQIDLLLADIELDKGMGGQALAQRLRRTRPHMRVLYTSGYSLEDCAERGGAKIRKEIQELMASFLPKPFTPSVLAEKVRSVLADMPTQGITSSLFG